MELYETAPAGTVTRARDLRRNPSDAEKRLWNALRDHFPAARFRRQVPVTPYFADFMSFRNRLILELDGGQHADPDAIAYDARRTAFLERKGYKVVRFWNSDVIQNLPGVLESIAQNLPLPPGEGRGPPRSGGKGEAGTLERKKKTSPSHAQARAGPSLSQGERDKERERGEKK
jgi:very-short-patch-repair endonuclease